MSVTNSVITGMIAYFTLISSQHWTQIAHDIDLLTKNLCLLKEARYFHLGILSTKFQKLTCTNLQRLLVRWSRWSICWLRMLTFLAKRNCDWIGNVDGANFFDKCEKTASTCIRLATNYCNILQIFLFYFFNTIIQLSFNKVCSIIIYDMLPTFWQRKDPASIELLGLLAKESGQVSLRSSSSSNFFSRNFFSPQLRMAPQPYYRRWEVGNVCQPYAQTTMAGSRAKRHSNSKKWFTPKDGNVKRLVERKRRHSLGASSNR